MKWSSAILSAAVVLATSCNAFTTPTTSTAPFVSRSSFHQPNNSQRQIVAGSVTQSVKRSLQLTMSLNADTPFTVGIVGATGAVGKEIRQVLEDRQFPIEKLRIFGSERSAGSTISTQAHGDVVVELFSESAARECDVVFLAVSGDFALEHARALTAGDDGCVCIDNSSAFRYEPDVPLVVPEINGQETKKSKLIANPNCTTAIALMALWPLHLKFGLKKILVSTYQAASGAGQPGMDELKTGTQKWLNGETVENKVFAHPLPFNVIPQIDKFLDNGYTKEEMKVTWESRKICGLADDFPVSCSAIRIPTIRAHSESIIVECEKPVSVEGAHEALSNFPGLKLVDDPSTLTYPMPLTATGQYDVEVGRVRKSIAFDNGLEFFVCGDQLLRGAALNAVVIAEEMAKNGSLTPKSSKVSA